VKKVPDVSVTLRQIADYIGGTVVGDPEHEVHAVVSPEKSAKNTVSVIWEERELGKMGGEGFLVGPPSFFNGQREGVLVSDPREAFVKLLFLFKSPNKRGKGVHPTALVAETARISPSAFIGPFCVVEDNSVIHDHVVLEAHVYIGANCEVGAHSVIEPMAVLFSDVLVGERTLIHSGAVIGCDGFGIIPSRCPKERPVKIPQVGGVVIGDDVEVGACSTIDRGTLDNTYIGAGVKIDDHVHVAHNVRIGENCILVAMTGLAGSTELGEGVIMAARSGAKDHVKIGDRAQVAAMSGAVKDVAPGVVVSGFPARDHKEHFKAQALYLRLPEIFSRLRELEKKTKSLEEEKE